MVICYGISKNGKANPNYFETSLYNVYIVIQSYKHNDPDSEYKIFKWNCSKGINVTDKVIDDYFSKYPNNW